MGQRSNRTIGGSAGTGEHAGSSRSTTSSGRAWRQTAASQCAPCRIFVPATTVGRLCPQRSSLRGDAVNSAGASGWSRSAPDRLNGIRVRRCGEAKGSGLRDRRLGLPGSDPGPVTSGKMSPDQHECSQGLIVSCAAVCGSRRLCAAGCGKYAAKSAEARQAGRGGLCVGHRPSRPGPGCAPRSRAARRPAPPRSGRGRPARTGCIREE